MCLKNKSWETLISKWRGNKQKLLLVMMSWKKIVKMYIQLIADTEKQMKTITLQDCKVRRFCYTSLYFGRKSECAWTSVCAQEHIRSLYLRAEELLWICWSLGYVWMLCQLMFAGCCRPQCRKQKVQESLLVLFEVQSWWNEMFWMSKKKTSIMKCVKSQWSPTVSLSKEEGEQGRKTVAIVLQGTQLSLKEFSREQQIMTG